MGETRIVVIVLPPQRDDTEVARDVLDVLKREAQRQFGTSARWADVHRISRD